VKKKALLIAGGIATYAALAIWKWDLVTQVVTSVVAKVVAL